MKLWAVLADASTGWRMIVLGQPGWRERFTISAAGLVTALAIFAFVAFLAVGFASMSIGMPHPVGVLAAMLVLALPIVAVTLTFLATRKFLGSEQPALDILVPAIYALTAFLVIEGLLALGGPVVMLSWVGLGYLIYRLVRVAAEWNVGIATGFAVLSVVLLVAMRLALYMLSGPIGPTT